jgi:membrane-associated protease RseP (regulator of RpoE activity)
VIRIKGPIPHRRALFDIGVAGPIAGFAVAVPLLIVGALQGTAVRPEPGVSGTLTFGDSLLTYLVVSILRPEARQMELAVGPLFIAGWLGLLATAMNLFPAGQLDGGHILYALSPRWHHGISLASGAFLAALVVTRALLYHQFSGWLLWVLVILFLARRHPPIPEESPLGAGRIFLAVVAGLILLLSFMPHPLDIAP